MICMVVGRVLDAPKSFVNAYQQRFEVLLETVEREGPGWKRNVSPGVRMRVVSRRLGFLRGMCWLFLGVVVHMCGPILLVRRGRTRSLM